MIIQNRQKPGISDYAGLIRRVYSCEGVLSSLKLMSYYLYTLILKYKKVYVMERELPCKYEDTGGLEDFKIRLLENRDFEQLKLIPGTVDLLDSLKNSRFAVIAEHKGKVIGVNWLKDSLEYLYEVDLFLKPAPRSAFAFGFYVLPAYRKRGIGTLMKKKLLKEAYKCGYEKVFIAVNSENLSSVSSAFKAGFIKTFEIELFRFLFIKKYRCSEKVLQDSIIELN